MEGYRPSIRILVATIAILLLMVEGTLVAYVQESEETESGQESTEESSSDDQGESEERMCEPLHDLIVS